MTMGLRNTLLGALVALSAVALATEDAQAFWGSRGSWGSYGGSWGSSGGSSGGSWGSSGGGYGSCGSWGSSGGSYGSGGSHGGFFRRHWGRRHGSSAAAGVRSAAATVAAVAATAAAGSAGGHASYGYGDGGYYVSNTTEFGPDAGHANPVKTTLTVRVPADAKITLAGVPTKQTGEVREFATNRLAAGQTWSNYTVRVEITRDGKTSAQDRTILLTGGQSQELDFDLGGMQVASKN